MNKLRAERRRTSARILAVDDQPVYLAGLQALLTSANYQVDTAGNGFDALVKLKRSLPDLVVSDLRMPRMSGFELLAVVRRRFPHIATVAISGEVTASEISGLLTDLFLEKGSYSPPQLLGSIRELLDRLPVRPRLPELESTVVCLPRSVTGNYGVACQECLRSFLVLLDDRDAGKPKCAWCPYCKAALPCFVDPFLEMEENLRIGPAA